jgi:hypothetical protein
MLLIVFGDSFRAGGGRLFGRSSSARVGGARIGHVRDITAVGNDETLSPDDEVDLVSVQMHAKRQRLFALGTAVIVAAREYVELCWTMSEYAKSITHSFRRLAQADPALRHLFDRSPEAPS